MTAIQGPQAEQESVISFTEQAQARVRGFMESRGKDNSALRVGIQGRSAQGFRYAMNLVDPTDREESDIAIDGGGFLVLVDSASAENLQGARVDFVETEQGAGFQIDNPNPVWRDELAMLVQQVLDTQINPGVASHGGYVELMEVRDGIAYVQLGGGCQGCGMADVTLKQGIEAFILEAVPGITAVRDSTDHDAGTNPYFRPSKG